MRPLLLLLALLITVDARTLGFRNAGGQKAGQVIRTRKTTQMMTAADVDVVMVDGALSFQLSEEPAAPRKKKGASPTSTIWDDDLVTRICSC